MPDAFFVISADMPDADLEESVIDMLACRFPFY
jgi:hypothetical protein